MQDAASLLLNVNPEQALGSMHGIHPGVHCLFGGDSRVQDLRAGPNRLLLLSCCMHCSHILTRTKQVECFHGRRLLESSVWHICDTWRCSKVCIALPK